MTGGRLSFPSALLLMAVAASTSSAQPRCYLGLPCPGVQILPDPDNGGGEVQKPEAAAIEYHYVGPVSPQIRGWRYEPCHWKRRETHHGNAEGHFVPHTGKAGQMVVDRAKGWAEWMGPQRLDTLLPLRK